MFNFLENLRNVEEHILKMPFNVLTPASVFVGQVGKFWQQKVELGLVLSRQELMGNVGSTTAIKHKRIHILFVGSIVVYVTDVFCFYKIYYYCCCCLHKKSYGLRKDYHQGIPYVG